MANQEQLAEQLFGAALDLPAESRTAFLDRECRTSPELRLAVEKLLEDNDRLGSFMAMPAMGRAADPASYASKTLPLSVQRFEPGQTIAERFLVVRFIARGGMGEVYEVKDQFLQSDRVALKIIRPEIAADASNLHRFEREVILARKVVHPNLCPIYEIFRCEQPAPPFLFLTMKLLEGETLDAWIRSRSSPSVADSLEISRQLLSGVFAMHAAKIIHRDLKPNNIMLTQSGERFNVSIMDFGLARLHATTDTTMLTAGMIAGTPGYMAPELFRGQPPTEATDLYALGVVLHQLFTGEMPVRSNTGVLSPVSSLRSGETPASWAQTIEAFLSSDPEERCRALDDIELGSKISANHTQVTQPTPPRRALSRYGAIGIIATIAAITLAMWLKPATTPAPLDSTQITSSGEPKEGPLFTDGSRLYFNSRGQPSEMAASGGSIVPAHIFAPGYTLLDISADGSKALALTHDMNDESGRGSLWSQNMLGGAPQKLNDHLAQFGRWAPDGRSLIFADLRTLYRMDADGSNLKKIWDAPQIIRDLSFSPDARRLSVSVYDNEASDSSKLWQLDAEGSNAHLVQEDGKQDQNQFDGQWTADGSHFVFNSDREGLTNVYELLVPHWFEFWNKPRAVRITGNQVDIQAFAPARDSKSLFVLGRLDQGTMQVLDPKTGKYLPYLDGLAALNFVISPDRQWMAYVRYPEHSLWKSRPDGSDAVELTNAYAIMPQWSPDGKSLAFSDWHHLRLISATGGTPQTLVSDSSDGIQPIFPTWSPDGKSIAWCYFPHADLPFTGIHVIDVETRKLSLVPGSKGYYAPSWSPDGRYLLAIAQNPSRMVIYSAETKTWKDLKRFDLEWGYWVWSSDSKSVYMAVVEGQTGIYQITVPGGALKKISGLDGVNGANGLDGFPSMTPDGRPTMMSRTGVAQIYSLAWKH
jgi:Tol biopolymer transport system component/tRNA A-37 threonylcarbamoyl transferase component Bud32